MRSPSQKIARLLLGAMAFLVCGTAWTSVHAAIAMFLEEPYGTFGHMNPTGHAAVYMNHICAASPTVLRLCEPGEAGVVISRYHRVSGYDWIAIPLIPYLYAVNNSSDIPATATPEIEAQVRDAYRRRNLLDVAPDGPDGSTPGGDWTQLVGASYDRKILGLNMRTSAEQDGAFIAIFNDRSNDGHFNLFYRNCADFSRTVINIFFPKAVHRNFIGDAGIMTPKQAAKSIVKYGKKHPELNVSPFVIPQVPGTIQRSRHVDGVTEAFMKSKKYMIPMLILAPEFTGGVAVTYVAKDRFTFPKDAPVLSGEALVKAETSGDNALSTPLPNNPSNWDTVAVPLATATSTTTSAMPVAAPMPAATNALAPTPQ
jgi:hypothetical protein